MCKVLRLVLGSYGQIKDNNFSSGKQASEHGERDAHVRMRTLFVLLVGQYCKIQQYFKMEQIPL